MHQHSQKNIVHRYAIVASRFNKTVVDKLLAKVLEGFASKGIDKEIIDIVYVPGSFEIASTINLMAKTRDYSAFIALGAIIRGETYHFECIANSASSRIGQLAITLQKPVIFGVLTTDSFQQAFDRVEQGRDYALHAIEMSELFTPQRKSHRLQSVVNPIEVDGGLKPPSTLRDFTNLKETDI